MKPRKNIASLIDIPNIGPATIKYLKFIDITEPMALIGQDPYAMYDELCAITNKRFDPCLIDVFISGINFMEGAPKREWHYYTRERKKVMASRER